MLPRDRPSSSPPHVRPGSPRWHSLPPQISTSAPSLETIVPNLQSTCTDTTARHSTYPPLSPPGFLYPRPIVPREKYEHYQDISGNMDNGIWYLPHGFEVVIFLVLFLGSAWMVVMWLIKILPSTWDWGQVKRKNKSRKADRKAWYTRLLAWRPWNEDGEGKEERRPLDKPSKYAPSPLQLHTASPETLKNGSAIISSAVPTSRIQFADQAGVEFTQRRIGTYTAHQRSRSTPPTAIRLALDESPATLPANPFLQPPRNKYLAPDTNELEMGLKPRRSPERLADGAAFFSQSPTCSPSPSITTSASYAHFSTGDMEALEAGTAPLTPHSRATRSHRKSKSWADLGLWKVEDAMNGWVESLARWTDDTGGDEGLLLPMVNAGGKKGVKAE